MERKIILIGGVFKFRVFCRCGWHYSLSEEGSLCGPSVCPKCGNYHGKVNRLSELKNGWFYFIGRQVKTGVPTKGCFGLTFYRDKRWMWDVVDDDIDKIPDSFIPNVFDKG